MRTRPSASVYFQQAGLPAPYLESVECEGEVLWLDEFSMETGHHLGHLESERWYLRILDDCRAMLN